MGLKGETMEKTKQRVRKLLAQAADRGGTPEGDVFYDKAFALMASYGLSERDLSAPNTHSEVARRAYEFTGAYTDMQAVLLHNIAAGLHCVGFSTGVHRSTKISSMTVFGLVQHLERVDVLFAVLSPHMVAQAKDLSAVGGMSAVVARRSFMEGFAQRIGQRLRRAENAVADVSTGYAIALLDDESRAEKARDAFIEQQKLTLSSKRSRRGLDAGSYARGVAAGSRTDLGQERIRGVYELGAS